VSAASESFSAEMVGAQRVSRLRAELAVSALFAVSVAGVLLWLAPAGTDFAAHAYGRVIFLRHGFVLWDNFWYAGRYPFATYSVLYYPLAAVFGIRTLAVLTIAVAALGFALVLERQWGASARWSSRAFAAMWAGIVLSAVFPFALGAAFGLLALATIQRGKRLPFAVLVALTLASSPLAFALLVVLLTGAALGSGWSVREVLVPAGAVCATGAFQLLLWLLFPGGGHFPFPLTDLLGALMFALLGMALTVSVPRARPLPWVFLIYGLVCVAVYFAPGTVGANIIRVRYAAFPCALLVLALRGWRPLWVGVVAASLAFAWNTEPFLRNMLASQRDAEVSAAYWRPAMSFLEQHDGRSFRVEAVDTLMHTPAFYLASAGIPLARGWFRQDDFPTNAVLYHPHLGRRRYLGWLHRLGVEYVVLSSAPPDYSSQAEAALLRSGRSGLTVVFRDSHLEIFRVPHPEPIVGPAPSRVLALTDERITVSVRQAGWYRIAVRYSPYWRTSSGCVVRGRDGMLRLHADSGGRVTLAFEVNGTSLIQALTGGTGSCPTVANGRRWLIREQTVARGA
jgi:hypothetical protein